MTLYNLFGEIINDPNKNDLDSTILRKIYSSQTDIERKLRNQNTKPQLNFLEPDKHIYEDLLSVFDNPDSVKTHKNRILGKRYKYIEESLLVKLNEEKTLSKYSNRLIEFYNKLNSAGILKISVSNLIDAFTIFTSFNAKGITLTMIDLLKSYYLK